MRQSKIGGRLLPSFLAAVLLTACSKHTAASLAPDKIPDAINQAFRQSTGDAKEAASQAVSACQNQNPAAAFTSLETLSLRGDLTPEQRSVASRAMVATMPKLQAAAAAGDSAAQATLHQYLSTR
jgi:hypothetical protein